jgi:hypothetical protein
VPEASALSQGFGVKLVRRGSNFIDFPGREKAPDDGISVAREIGNVIGFAVGADSKPARLRGTHDSPPPTPEDTGSG